MDNIKYAIEGILFAAGEPVKAAKLAVVLDTSVDEVNKAVDELKKEYSENHRGFNIIDILEGYQICSRPEYYTYIQEILAAFKCGNGGTCDNCLQTAYNERSD